MRNQNGRKACGYQQMTDGMENILFALCVDARGRLLKEAPKITE